MAANSRQHFQLLMVISEMIDGADHLNGAKVDQLQPRYIHKKLYVQQSVADTG